MVVIMQNTHEKSDLQKTKVNTTKQERFMQTEIDFILGKNGGYMPSNLGCRSIVVVRQADKNLAVCKIFKIWQLYFLKHI